MPSDEELVEEHWPHLNALLRMLNGIEGRTVAAPPASMATSAATGAPTVDAIIRQINQRAQAGPVFVAGAVHSSG